MPITETEKKTEIQDAPPLQASELEAKNQIEQDDEDEESEEEVDHPMDRLMNIIETIDGQQNRLRKKQTHDLRAELTLNIYPMLKNALQAIAEYFDILDESEDDEETGIDPEQVEELKKMAEEEGRKILEAVNLILEMDKILDTQTRSKLPEQYDKILAWAREKRDVASGQVPDSVLNADQK